MELANIINSEDHYLLGTYMRLRDPKSVHKVAPEMLINVEKGVRVLTQLCCVYLNSPESFDKLVKKFPFHRHIILTELILFREGHGEHPTEFFIQMCKNANIDPNDLELPHLRSSDFINLLIDHNQFDIGKFISQAIRLHGRLERYTAIFKRFDRDTIVNHIKDVAITHLNAPPKNHPNLIRAYLFECIDYATSYK